MVGSFGRIRFGSGSLIYLGVVALLVTTSFYTQANLLFWALGLVIGGLVISLFLSLIMLRGVEVQRLTPTRGTADEPLVLRYLVTNRSRLGWFGLEIVELWHGDRGGKVRPMEVWQSDCKGHDASSTPILTGRPHGWLLHVGPGQTIQAEALCWPRHRGVLKFERIHLRTGFPFGILYKVYEYRQDSVALIHPPQRPMNRQTVLSLSSRDVGLGRHSERAGGQDEFFGLRPYRPGDNFKLIDWKHSARTANLVSREMTKARPPRMMILLDLSIPDAGTTTHAPPDFRPAQEEAINLTAALIREAFLHDVHVGLSVRGAYCPPMMIRHSQAHHQSLLDSLATLNLNDQREDRNINVRPTVVVRLHPQDGRDSEPGAVIVNTNGRLASPIQHQPATARPTHTHAVTGTMN